MTHTIATHHADLHSTTLRALPTSRRRAALDSLSERHARALLYDWPFWARPEQLPPPGDWRLWLIIAGRGWGKALALDTSIPTLNGWTTMAVIRMGDQLFDELGQPCTVTCVSPVYEEHKCYRLTFSDGTQIVADAEHEWLTVDRRTRKALARRTGVASKRRQSQPRYFPRTVTTQEIADSLYDAGEVNHAVANGLPIQCPERDLPIDPYVLGAWLGDGSSKAAEITCADGDVEIIERISAAGYRAVRYSTKDRAPRYGIGGAEFVRDPVTGRMQSNSSLHSTLKTLNLMQNKHIPSEYLRSSYEQRLSLMQGLMDTDGYSQKNGTCEFTSTNKALADGMYELCISLGLKATMGVGRATLEGRYIGPKYRVAFTPYIPVFRLKRKASLVKQPGAQHKRQLRRYIVDVSEIPSVPVRCIKVDSPSHLFLASRSMIPTHNTRTGAETVRAYAERGRYGRMALIAPTAADARDVLVEGHSGLLAVCPPWFAPKYEPSKRRLTWPNGALATTYSAEEPDRLRGPQHDFMWADEPRSWPSVSAWDNALLGLRLGRDPRAIATTTPGRTPLVRKLLATPGAAITRGTTYDNRANLAAAFFEQIVAQYEGTTLGRQELLAELLEDVDGALWKMAMIDAGRVPSPPAPLPSAGRPKGFGETDQAADSPSPGDARGGQGVRAFRRIVVAIDPAASSGEASSETGIVVAGLGDDGHATVLADLSLRGTPHQWAARAVAAYHDHQADRIVAEVNNGGDLVEAVIRTVDPTVSYRRVHASRGKLTRAEPVAALYEQGKVHHAGLFPQLEDQMCSWVPGDPSPDRMDALVWALTDLMLGPGHALEVVSSPFYG